MGVPMIKKERERAMVQWQSTQLGTTVLGFESSSRSEVKRPTIYFGERFLIAKSQVFRGNP